MLLPWIFGGGVTMDFYNFYMGNEFEAYRFIVL